MFLDFLRKIQYVRIISFIAIVALFVMEKMFPGTVNQTTSDLTGIIGLIGLVKSWFPYVDPVLPTLDSASNPLNQ
jgi:hypothetical protein